MQVCKTVAPALAERAELANELAFTLLRLGCAELAMGNVNDGSDSIFAAADALERWQATTTDSPSSSLVSELMFYAALVNLYHVESVAQVDDLLSHFRKVRTPPRPLGGDDLTPAARASTLLQHGVSKRCRQCVDNVAAQCVDTMPAVRRQCHVTAVLPQGADPSLLLCRALLAPRCHAMRRIIAL